MEDTNAVTYGSAKEFRKKPVTVLAWRIPKEFDADDIPSWARSHVIVSDLDDAIRINTREGSIYGQPGDWLIQGVRGEVYPCGDEIFRETYEPVG